MHDRVIRLVITCNGMNIYVKSKLDLIYKLGDISQTRKKTILGFPEILVRAPFWWLFILILMNILINML